MISAEKASSLEQRLSKVIECRPDELRDWFYGHIDRGPRNTGLRFVRGTHSGAFVSDPDGTDELPPGYEPPPEWKPPAGYRPRRY